MLLVINAVLIALHLILHWANLNLELTNFMQQLVERFNMDAEASVPTWFASTLLLINAGLLGYIGLRQKKGKFYKHWIALSAIFLYLSIDEASQIHELAIEPMQALLGIESGFLFFAWFIPAVIIIGILGVIFFKFFTRLPKQTKTLLIIALVLYLAGAVGMEMISGAYWEMNDFVYDMNYRIFNVIEEGLENTGLIIAVYALLKYSKFRLK